MCGLLKSATLFKMRPMKINIAAKHNDLYFQRYKDVLDVFLIATTIMVIIFWNLKMF